MSHHGDRMRAALNRLTKWRSVLTGWHLGTRQRDEPGVAAMRDLQDFRLIIRAELNGLISTLLEKDVLTRDEFDGSVAEAAIEYEAELQRLFPGYRATDHGMVIHPTIATETNRARHFPP